MERLCKRRTGLAKEEQAANAVDPVRYRFDTADKLRTKYKKSISASSMQYLISSHV